jgi:hypothetical protein
MRRIFGVMIPVLALTLVLGGCGSVDEESPFAEAGPDQTVLVGTRVLLDGSASRAPEGVDLLFHWALVGLPEGSSAVLSDPEAPFTTFVPDIEGIYYLRLAVSDGELTSQDALAIKAVGPDPFAPRADAGPDQTVHPGALVILDGSASRAGDSAMISFHWVTLERPRESRAKLSNPNSPTPSFFADAQGIYRFQLTVVGSSGARESDTVSVFAGTPPVDFPPPVISKGQRLYDELCSVCHSLGIHDPFSGGAPDLFRRGVRVEAVFTAPHAGIALTHEEISALRDFVDAN